MTDEHLANVALAFAASPLAVDVGERVDVLRRQVSTHSATGTAAEFRITEDVAGRTLGEYLAGEIHSLRQGQKPVVETLTVSWRDGEALVHIVLAPFKGSQDGAWRPCILGFGNSRIKRRGPGPEISIMITTDLLQMLADFLGPIEDSAE